MNPSVGKMGNDSRAQPLLLGLMLMHAMCHYSVLFTLSYNA